MHLNFKQKGNFTIEFAMIGVFLSLIFVFSSDVIIKMSIKGKLDRLSYSLVSVLKERTQLYGAGGFITRSEATAISDIAENSLQRTLSSYDSSKFGLIIEELTFKGIGMPNRVNQYFYRAKCETHNRLTDLQSLSVVTIWDRQTSLYRITLCYMTDNMISDLLDITDFDEVNSSSVIIGR